MEEKSFEFKIWSKTAPDEELSTPRMTEHEIVALPTEETVAQNIPAEVYLSVTGIKYLTTLRVTPAPTGKAAYSFVRKYLERLANTLDGVLEDGLSETRFSYFCEKNSYRTVNEYTEMLSLSVWFVREGGFEDIRESIVEAFEEIMPYALPSKYGTGISPDIEYGMDEPSRAKLLSFWAENPAISWSARTPVTHVFVSDCTRTPSKREGGRVNRLSIMVPDEVYEIEEWREALRRLLKRLSVITGSFFGQICRGESGVVSWWWQGLPIELGVACTIGEPYYSLIPDCAELGSSIGTALCYFEEPLGPYVDKKYLSVKKKNKAIRRSGVLLPDDFETAEECPVVLE